MITAFQLKNVPAPVFAIDCSYPSAELINAIINVGHKLIMCCSSGFLHSMKLPAQGKLFEYKFAKLTCPPKPRVLKIQLFGEKTENLITNIFDSKISPDDFKWTNQKRQGIESRYNDVKSKL